MCTCNSIREGSAGSYSLATLGVECDYCEARNAEADYLRMLENETELERVSRVMSAAVFWAGVSIRKRAEKAEAAAWAAAWGETEPPF